MKNFFKKHTILFLILVAVWALLSNLTSTVFEGILGDSLMMYFVADIICNAFAILPLILMVKWGYIKKSNKKRILLGILVGTPYLLFGIRNLLPLILVHPMLFQVQWGLLFVIIVDTIGIGILEEAGLRGVVLPLLCEKWQERKHPYLMAAFASSALFACVHLNWSVRYLLAYGELPLDYLASNLYQVYYAFCFGFLAAGVALYARSIIPMVIWHAFCDFTAYVTAALLPLTTYENYCNNGVLTPQNVFKTYGILGGYKYADEIIFGLINLLFLILGVVLIRKAEKQKVVEG